MLPIHGFSIRSTYNLSSCFLAQGSCALAKVPTTGWTPTAASVQPACVTAERPSVATERRAADQDVAVPPVTPAPTARSVSHSKESDCK